jgi:hypothetical protein
MRALDRESPRRGPAEAVEPRHDRRLGEDEQMAMRVVIASLAAGTIVAGV